MIKGFLLPKWVKFNKLYSLFYKQLYLNNIYSRFLILQVVVLALAKYHLLTALFKPFSTMWSAHMLADHIVEKGLNKAVRRLYFAKTNTTTTRERGESPLGKRFNEIFYLAPERPSTLGACN